MIRSARPECHEEPCANPTPFQLLFLFSSLALMALGAGGIRPCTLAFTADQINNPENPKNESTMKSFFNWYYVSVGISVSISVIFIVYIQVKEGWGVGFGIPVGLMSFSAIMFFSGSSLYIKVKPNKSLLTSLAQVIVVAWKNRHLPLPPKNSDTWYSTNHSNLLQPTDKVRYAPFSYHKFASQYLLCIEIKYTALIAEFEFYGVIYVMEETQKMSLTNL